MNMNQQRALTAIKLVIPSTLKTIWWLVKITLGVSFAILLLRYFGIVAVVSDFLSPVFSYIGLPGETALAFVTGYFVNVYSAIAVMTSLHLCIREITILSAMILCAHNMITETAVQSKTGSSVIRIVFVRTISAVILGLVLNLMMPISENTTALLQNQLTINEKVPFLEFLLPWLLSIGKTLLKMVTLIFTLSILQAIMSEFGVIQYISKKMKYVMLFFGLSPNSAFLWIVANTLGLAYGASVMLEEKRKGTLSKQESDLLNHHIGISHSNLEDILLLAAVGAMVGWLLLSRWIMSFLLVWERRLEILIKNKLNK